MTAPGTAQSDVLMISLSAAVPLWIDELCRMTPHRRRETMNVWRADGVEAVCERGDVLQYGGGKRDRGEAAKAFNHLARGLAVLAHAPGGVLFAGMHFCLDHPGGKHAASIVELTCESPGWPGPQPAPEPRPVETATVSGVL